MGLSHRHPGPTAVYRLYDSNDRLLYVGITIDVEQRWKEHSKARFWWHLVARKEVIWHPQRAGAVAEEHDAIRDEAPLYNQTWPNGTARRRIQDPFIAPVHARLREAILSGTYPSGSPLPSEEALAQQYGVSRSSVSSAVYRLHSERLVRQGRPIRKRQVFVVAEFVRDASAQWPVSPVS